MKSTNNMISMLAAAALATLLTACGGNRPKGELPPPADPPAPAPVVQQTPAPPVLPQAAPEPPSFALEGVNFDTDRATLKPSARDILDNAAALIPQFPDVNFRVGGHTDNHGSEAYNQRLSERRVRSVIEYLTSHGVSRGQLVGIGYGESLPIDTNDTAFGRARNRRVEIIPIK